MNHVLSASEYSIFDNPRAQAIKEALIQFSLYDTQPVVFESFENKFILSDDISLSQAHESYLLSKYDNLEQINENESLLLANYYSPEFLSRSGKYDSTVNYLKTVNEGVISTITTALSSMTEGGSAIGILQFALDIVGLIPTSWIGIPIDMAANLINGIIYSARQMYLLSFLSFISLIDITKLFTPFKTAIKGLKSVQDFFGQLWKGTGFGKPAAEALLKTTEAVKNKNLITMLGKVLGKVVRWLSTIGLKFLKSLIGLLVKAVDTLTLGVFKLDKYIPMLTRGIDTMTAKLTGFCTEAEAAVKVIEEAKAVGTKTATTSADAVTKAAKNTADKAADKFAKKTGREMPAGFKKGAENASNVGMTNKLGKVESFAEEVYKKSEAKFEKLFPNVTHPGIKKAYAYNDAAKELVDNILNKKSGLLSITKNPKIMREFAQGKVWKGADKILSDAIRKGDPTVLTETLTKMIDDPEFFKLVSLNSPDVAKTMMTFKNAPEALITGARNFKDFGKKWGKWKGMRTLRTLPTFLLKVAVKTTECGQFLGNLNSANTLANNVWDIGSSVAKQQYNNAINEDNLDMLNMASVLDRVYEQTTDPELDVSRETLEELRRTNPDAYQALVTAEAEATRKARELKDRTNSKNPCLDLFNIKQAEVGAGLKEPKPKPDSKQLNIPTDKVVKNLKTPEDFKNANTDNYTKGALSKIGEPDAMIEAQHPLHDQSPVVKAYFSNVVTIGGEILPTTENDPSRLDAQLDAMIRDGFMQESEREGTKAYILESWKNQTVPKEVEEAANPTSVPVENPPNTNESKFKIGKLIAKR